ncbi:MAG TPA: hypothetical protein VMC62_02705 [Longilinea sp.]|nr:hypothetical protein [Longilinea sp.]
MSKTKYSQILEDVANEQVPSTFDLAPQILSRIEKGKRNTMKKAVKFLIPTLAVILILAVVTLTIPVVAQTLQQWFGYVPGFGFVGKETVRILDEPVSVSQRGFTLTVEKVFSSSKKTMITYSLNPVTADMISDDAQCFHTGNDPRVILPDGSELNLMGLGTSPDGSVLEYEATFSGIPVGVDQFTLKIDCLERVSSKAVPSTWKVDLRLGSGSQSEVTPLPIIDVTSVPTNAMTAANALQVLQIVQLDDGILLSGTLAMPSVKDGWTISEDGGFLDTMSAADANGQCVPVTMSTEDFTANLSEDQTSGKIPWSAEALGSDFAWPLTLTVESVTAAGPAFAPTTFKVDLGQGLQPGGVLPLNLDVPLGNRVLHVISVQRMETQVPDMVFLNFAFTYDPSFNFSFQIEGYAPMGGGGGGDFGAGTGSCTEQTSASDEIIYEAHGYRTNIPAGLVTIDLTGYPVEQIHGPWHMNVEKPAMP